ncbi:unnamed protein product, partial [Ectocarpus sp. 12 AP-2014]
GHCREVGHPSEGGGGGGGGGREGKAREAQARWYIRGRPPVQRPVTQQSATQSRWKPKNSAIQVSTEGLRTRNKG